MARRAIRILRLSALLGWAAGGLAVACGGEPSSDDCSANCAQTGAGGTTSSGGSATGGQNATGGAGVGGSAPTGGAASTGGSVNNAPDGLYQMEALDRGVVAVVVDDGVYVSWRMMGYEYSADDPGSVSYNLYKDGTLLANVTDSTNFVDEAGSASSSYSVSVVLKGVEGEKSEAVAPWAENYLRIPISAPGADYEANDGSTGDVDGDGKYEIFLKWNPTNAKDNSQAGVTGNVYLEALKLDGTRLWRIDLGPNIRAGAHYTQFVVADFDGDGKAELAVKTAPGTKDGSGAFLSKGPAANDDDSAVYRNDGGYILTGPEYLTVFAGDTGAELDTVAFDVPRGTVSAWGDGYGNRVDRFLATAAFGADGTPSFIMARGYYTRTTLTSWSFKNGAISQNWKFDSDVTGKDENGHNYYGQGSHSMVVANVDDDPGQEIMYGAMAVDDDGKGLCSTGYNHGDAIHVGDLVPSRAGLEFFMCNEDGAHPAFHLRDARTCEILEEGPINGADTGRCVADDISASNPGAEMWSSSVDGLLAAETGDNIGNKPSSQNFLIYWDGDETRELENGTSISKYGGGTLQDCSACASNNGTKSTPTLTADLLGDWREEIIWRESNNTALRLYTTTAVTERRLYTLMHDPQYRMQVSSEQTAYNQPPHVGFHIGSGMATPPVPDIHVR